MLLAKQARGTRYALRTADSIEKGLFLQAILLKSPIELNLCGFSPKKAAKKAKLDMLFKLFAKNFIIFYKFFLTIYGNLV